jgi:hypothetical protein
VPICQEQLDASSMAAAAMTTALGSQRDDDT